MLAATKHGTPIQSADDVEEVPVFDIVLAEDNTVQRAYLAKMIQRLGYNTIEAENGLEALEKVCSTGAHILISDYQMPILDGIELTRAVRSLQLDHYVHIIVMTGMDQPELGQAAIEAGADDILAKGHDPARLLARLRTASRLISHAQERAVQHRVLKDANDRIQADLAAAALAQRQLLPNIHKEIQGVHISSAFVPSSVVSGDMFGWFALPDNKLGVYAVDVSGHGINASLLSVAIGHLITPEFFMNVTFGSDGRHNPAGLASTLNSRFCSSYSDNYFTMFSAIIDRPAGRIDYCQAGYPSPVFVAPNADAQLIGDGGFPVGMFGNATYENASAVFKEGSLLVLFSDAAIEAENAGKTPFGVHRLRELIARNSDVNCDHLPDLVVQTLLNWRGGKVLEDDLTVVALKRTQ